MPDDLTNHVELTGDPSSAALRIDGHLLPFSAAVLRLQAPEIPVLSVALPVIGGAVVTLDAKTGFDESTRAALIAMGWTPPPEPGSEAKVRRATFAGFLGFGDYSFADGLVSIDVRPRDVLSSLPPNLTEQISGTDIAGWLEGRKLEGAGIALDGNPVRSPRPYVTATMGWSKDNAGLGAEDAGRRFAAGAAAGEADRAGLPGDALEVWLLPVVQFEFDYLITPAGDWPPAEPET